MTPIHREITRHRIAWRGRDFASKDDIAFDLSAKHVSGLKDVLRRISDMPRDSIRKQHCLHPALDADFASVLDELMNGRGLVLVRGIPVQNHSIEEIEKMYWAVGAHIGAALSQNSFGMLMSRVQEERLADGSAATRGTKSRHELAFHTDEAEVFGLMCVRPAKEGGTTQYASIPAIHNEILATRPDVLPTLYKGFPHHRRGEQPDDQPVVSPYDVPVFCNVDGVVSGVIVYGSIMAALHVLGREPTGEEVEALDVVQECATRLQYDLTWEAGEAAFANNFAMFHARSDYVDWDEPDRKRLLLRYWLEVPPEFRRPMPKEMHFVHNAGWRSGIDAVPGRLGRVATNDYTQVPESVAKIIQAQQQRRKRAQSNSEAERS
jgi:hypothetical protein